MSNVKNLIDGTDMECCEIDGINLFVCGISIFLKMIDSRCSSFIKE